MSTLSKKQRDALPKSAFCDPERRLFPILDQDDVTKAAHLIGKAHSPAVKACVIAKAKRSGWKIPDAWKSDASMSDAACTNCGSADDLAVLLNSPLLATATFSTRGIDDLPDEAWFAGSGNRGNIRALLAYWKKQMGGGSGRAGDYDECVRVLQNHPAISDPHRLCNWLHERATGAAPGHAAAEHNAGPGVFVLSSAAQFAGSDTVVRRGKLFECGDYPDKRFSLTPEEAFAAAADFVPVPNDLEHRDTVLSGKLGRLRSLELAEDSWSLEGDVEIPRWLHEVLGDEPVPVSLSWDRDTKRVIGNALVLTPRISDAAVMSAYADFARRHDTDQGQSVMQSLHDHAAAAGAVCSPGNIARMASRHEAQAIQQVHDVAVSHGAACNTRGRPAGSMLFGKEKTMSFADKFKAWFTGGMVGDLDFMDGDALTHAPFTGTHDHPHRAHGFKPDADGDHDHKHKHQGDANHDHAHVAAEMSADPAVAAMQAELARLRSERISEQAAAFADAEVRAGRSLPADTEHLITQYTQAAVDDAAHGVVTFADGKTSTRVELLKAREAARPAHGLTAEQLDFAKHTVFSNAQTTRAAGAEQPLSAERRAELLGASQLGQSVLRGQNGTHA